MPAPMLQSPTSRLKMDEGGATYSNHRPPEGLEEEHVHRPVFVRLRGKFMFFPFASLPRKDAKI